MAQIPYDVAGAFLGGRKARRGAFVSNGRELHSYAMRLAHHITACAAAHCDERSHIVFDQPWEHARQRSATTARHVAAARFILGEHEAFRTIDDVREANRQLGHHWFDADTIRFFRTRILGVLEGGRYFVTSERGPDDVRRYSVREALGDGAIETVGEFGEWATASQAKNRAHQLAINA